MRHAFFVMADLYKLALVICEKALGPDHRHTATCVVTCPHE
jgi:hypothetical protein